MPSFCGLKLHEARARPFPGTSSTAGPRASAPGLKPQASAGRLTRLDLSQPGIGTTSRLCDGAGTLTATVNPAGQTTSYAGHNGLGLPATVTGPDGLATTYDQRGQPRSATQSTPSGSRQTSWTRTPERLLKQQTHPNGFVISYSYSYSYNAASNRLSQVSYDNAGNRSSHKKP